MQKLTDLVLQCRNAPSAEALNELLRAVYPDIILGLKVYCGKDASIEDFAQEAMLKIIQNIGKLKATTFPEFRAWALTIATRIAVDYYRKTSVKNLSILDPDEIERLRDAGAQNEEPGFGLSNDGQRALRVLQTMDSPCRELLTLRYIHGLDYAEIGEMTEKSYDAVRVALTRCLREAQGLFDNSSDYAR